MEPARHLPLPANCRLFIAFRVLFNARFYYPVLGVLFLDLGVSLGEYALLNTAWAVAIVLFEVPSGALADHFGRRRMVVAAALLMVIEMVLLAFAPIGHAGLLIACLLLNRILSGVAEAFASGADEALAYDTLAALGRADEWPRVLDMLGRWQAGAFFVAMISGAAVFDPAWINAVIHFLGREGELNASQTLRFPLYLTLATSLATLTCAMALREPARTGEANTAEHEKSAATALRRVLAAGRWVLGHRVVLLLLLSGLTIDSIVRLFLTINSNYYRLIGIPEGWYGLIGASFSLTGFVSAPLARRMVTIRTRRSNFLTLAMLALLGLGAVALVRHPFGLLASIPLALSLQMLGFFLSYYLNAEVESGQRATVLSFRGLAFNLGYGGVGLAFSLLCAGIARDVTGDGILDRALVWLPVWLLAAGAAVVLFSRLQRKKHP